MHSLLRKLTVHLQIERLMRRDGCSREDAQAKIASQMPLTGKRGRSTFTIENDGSQEETAHKACHHFSFGHASWTT